jgi:hypothetical protein
MHNEELHNLYCSPHIIRKNKSIGWARNATRIGVNVTSEEFRMEECNKIIENHIHHIHTGRAKKSPK